MLVEITVDCLEKRRKNGRVQNTPPLHRKIGKNFQTAQIRIQRIFFRALILSCAIKHKILQQVFAKY